LYYREREKAATIKREAHMNEIKSRMEMQNLKLKQK
jgi:hypothetical protein